MSENEQKLYNVYRSEKSGQWEYEAMTPDEIAGKVILPYEVFGFMTREAALKKRDDLRALVLAPQPASDPITRADLWTLRTLQLAANRALYLACTHPSEENTKEWGRADREYDTFLDQLHEKVVNHERKRAGL